MTEEVTQPEDFGKDGPAIVKRWLTEIKLAREEEKDWREDVKRALKTYRGENYQGSGDDKRRKDTFNILWSNVETLRPAIYNTPPRPDVRRRFRDEDKLGKVIAELMERCATYAIDNDSFEQNMVAAVNDCLLPGRAITRIRYVPTIENEELVYEEALTEQVQWDDFTHGPGRTWSEVNWIAFDHRLTKDEIEDKWADLVDKVQYDVTDDEKTDKEEETVYKRCLVHEIWDRQKRKVTFIAPSFKDRPLSVEDDPLNLKEFWPIPRPLHAVEDSSCLVPIVEYCLYETLARELEKVTNRIRKVLDGIRIRGIYDSRISELRKLFEAADNELIPAENVAAILDAGGIEKTIWMNPNDKHIQVLVQLYEYRNSVIQSIYEATGISDILRGASNPNETLGAQEIKANFGTQRLQRRQRDMQRYVRDIIRIIIEIVAEKFSPQTIAMITGMQYPTNADKQQAQATLQAIQQQVAQVQAQMQMLPPEQQQAMAQQMEGQKQQAEQAAQQAQEVLAQPSWEDLKQVMTNDLMRCYRIDIETDSTVEAQLQDDQKNIVELLGGIANYFQGIAEPVASGYLPLDAAKRILLAAVRRFKLGSEVEDEIDKIQQPEPRPDPNEAKGQMEAQKMQAEMQREDARFQMDQQAAQVKAELDRERMNAEREKLAMEMEAARQNHAMEMEIMRAKSVLAKQQHQQAMQAAKEKPEAA